ncbi:hypothetical protein DNTS_002876 [Danionella cerebrum]|uniref:Uncharacterized protein n=1 Tax=Danionella cerebrum TaxID=2873325 RepID=A0A553QUX4_9TELE|nr:hypothetical protein DNTS_002876 [Danionella translucida]
MELFKTKFLHMTIYGITILLNCSALSEERIKHHIETTVFEGETVMLHCNQTALDDDFTWIINKSVIFRMFPNKTIRDAEPKEGGVEKLNRLFCRFHPEEGYRHKALSISRDTTQCMVTYNAHYI